MTRRSAAEAFLTVEQVRESPNCGCITDTTPDDETIEGYVDAASDVIAISTGMRIRGRQTLIARPCRDACVDMCPCCGLDVIPLGDEQPVVTQVKIDGEVLDSAYYWLHWNRVSWVLARRPLPNETTPRNWPSWQKRYLADTEDDTFSITFTTGTFVDQQLIVDAALEIVCDLATDSEKLANTIEGAISADMGGVRVELQTDLLARIRAGEMGPMTRRMMGLLAPDGRSYSMVWAPELTLGWQLNLEVAP